jgi:UDP:flavonoid glycosyltransferase YjiC (YdhE family)
MSQIVIASVPIHGHVTPLLAVATGLVARGHTVRFLTGARFEAQVRRSGATFVPLPAAADYDDRVLALEGLDPERGTGIRAMRYDIDHNFFRPARAQYEALRRLDPAPDVVLAEPAFVGATLLAGHPKDQRPAVVGAGVLPLMLSGRTVAPFGLGLPPLGGPVGVVRNTLLTTLVHRVIFGELQHRVDDLFDEVHGRPADTFMTDWLATTDAIVQFSVPAIEYPRPDAAVPVYYAGPVSSAVAGTAPLPDWWADLDGDRPVVHVTQGTIANIDFSKLVRPTLDALADAPVLVVVTTGGRPAAELGPLPANARAAEFLPYDRLLPRTRVMVTNGGFGGVQYALEHGVPLVIAGDTEDKPEVAARVAWSGAGINLHTGRPRRDRLRTAVRHTLVRPDYRRAARAVARQMRDARGIDEVDDVITGVLAAQRAR